MSSQRILIVDDHVESAEGLAELLDLWGHETHVAHDGADALAMAPRIQPTIALLDLGLPDMDGCELARRLRAEDLPGMSLVALTGSNTPDDRARVTAAGFAHHLVKPVDLQQLQRLLDA
jgi:two-component system, sensor histidine kinase